MTRTGAALLCAAFLMISLLMAIFSVMAMPQIDAFENGSLEAPGSYTPPSPPSLPAVISGDTTDRPDILAVIYVPRIFAGYGGSVRLNITNNDSRPLIIEEVGFRWTDMSASSNILLNGEISPGATISVRVLAVDGPADSGNCEYQLTMRVLQKRNNQWYRVLSANDEWLTFSSHVIDVEDLHAPADNPIVNNPRHYYVQVNDLVRPGSEEVEAAAENAVSGIGGGFSMGQACAVFDYIDSNLNYTLDPDDSDTWYSPEETLAARSGDCEDYALLLAAMVESAGGYSRVYLTADHAFAAVYVGSTEAQMESAASDVRAYYRTDVETQCLRDDTGYWMVADPLGSFHLGGLAVGQSPTEYTDGAWNTAFTESETLYAIDVTGASLHISAWLEPNLWFALSLLFGFMTAGFAASAQTGKSEEKMICHICAGDIGDEEPYICPECRTAYHRPCAFSQSQCMNCGVPTNFPPPRNLNDEI